MNPSFGPWSTALGSGNHPKLSTFWKRRMTMLQLVPQRNTNLRGRMLVWLGIVGICACAMPTVRIVWPSEARSEEKKSVNASNEQIPSLGRLEGQLLMGSEPRVREMIVVHFQADKSGDSLSTSTAITDSKGRFVFEEIPSGEALVELGFRTENGGWLTLAGLRLPVEVVAGKTSEVTLGGRGRPIIGQVVLSAGSQVALRDVRARMYLEAPHIGFPGDEMLWEAYSRFAGSKAGEAYFRRDLCVDDDGKLRIENVPSGSYFLQLYVPGSLQPDSTDSLSLVVRRFKVPLMPNGTSSEAIDLGQLTPRRKG